MSAKGKGKTPVKVVLGWHMHQPSYLDPCSGEYRLPWTYLHATKDYVDMVAHLEAIPEARAVVNFSPTLIEQIQDYTEQVAGHLRDGRPLHDPLLRALADPTLPEDACDRERLVQWCLRANEAHLIERWAPFAMLAELGRWVEKHPGSGLDISDRFLADLITWYHLAWLGESVRRGDARVKRLMDKERGFSVHDRRELLVVIGELLQGVIPRYRALAEEGRVELSVTPYAHPILPLLQDLTSVQEAWPDAPMPTATHYPGGAERARWHIQRGLEVFEAAFGFRPAGCWPAEGSVSDATLAELEAAGFAWAASGGSVLDNSLADAEMRTDPDPEWHRAYTVGEGAMRCFFRDDGLSDLIGFNYADWHGDDAVANLVSHLETIVAHCADRKQAVIPIILDGENAWEHYPANGWYFLSALYRRLADHPELELTTFAEAAELPARQLPRVIAGSWVWGSFSTWIGEREKNRGWELLVEAKRAFDGVVDGLDAEARDRAEVQLAICESSDWFWWFGDYNPAGIVAEFDHLYRLQLIALYERLGLHPPEHLSHAFAHGGGADARGGAMQPGRSQ
ncbi:Alpha-amylase/alpha-mannosidase, GH57 family [Thiohalospira halophila DSM 15071]|uniref:Alpha-amylase/alpha-mannosidase, GH57 family n=1 Tax=Thiohalospira halophila DSM 15071 TaxID=1123397 RepID=A0A1I1NWU4_9GAMM|nr:glycoside hydrolase family 57 protein [Thiohalospira halophila]SFD01802.1 Alpha-amylase/alpha-mannosidase, GH57 family [Thiohalospira halophila DSM 15071]